MVFECKGVRCCVLIACLVALALNLGGFASPGWLILKRTVFEEKASIFEGQVIDNGGVKVPEEAEDKPLALPERQKRSDEELEVDEEEVIEENGFLIDWFRKVTVEITEYEVRMHYGLWYATMCVHEKDGKHGDSSSSSDEDEHHKDKGDHHKKGKKGHCHCKKISIKCALYNSFIFEDPIDYINPGGPSKRVLSHRNFGYASLVEQRIENCLSLAFIVIGVISALGGVRKSNGCRCAAYACIVFMLLSALVVLVPVTRFAHYSMFKHNQVMPIHVTVPYSAVCSGVSSILCVIIALAIGCGLAKKSRVERAGHWYKFNNELELPKETEEKKPQLVFYTEPLPEKPDSLDI